MSALHDALAVLDSLPPDLPESPSETDLQPWRTRIDAVDKLMIYLLNERAHCALEIGEITRHLGMPVYVPSREEQVLKNVMQANPGPLPDQAVRRLYERVIDETRSLERATYQDKVDAQRQDSNESTGL